MLRFESQYMRECINDGSDQVMMQYCSLCLYELNRLNKRVQQRNYQNAQSVQINAQSVQINAQSVQINAQTFQPYGQTVQPWFILRTVSQLSALFKNKAQSPILKFKATKLLTYLLLINEPQIYHKFQLQLYPLMKNICLYNKSQPIQQRGIDYFKNNKYYEIGNFQEKQKIKQIGVKFIIYCLQLVLVMNKWWRVDQIDRMEITPYGKGYDALLKQGVKFMEEEDMIFWGDNKISQIIKNINKCTTIVNEKRLNIQSTGLYKHNINNVSNLSNTSVSVSYTENPSRLNKQMQQKDNVIKELRIEIDKVRRQKQGLMGEFSRQRQQWENRVQECERKLRQMKGIVRILKKKLNNYQNINNLSNSNKDKLNIEKNEEQKDYESMLFSTQQSQPSFINQMRKSIKLLISQNLKLQQQNKQLKTQLQSLQQKVQKQLRVKKNIDINERRQLIEQVLKNQCKQKRQIQGSLSLKNNKANKNKQQLFKSNEFLLVKQTPIKQNRLNKAKSVQNINVKSFNSSKQHFNSQKQQINSQKQHFNVQKVNNRQSKIPYPFESPFYRCLSSQVRTRLKRCLLKRKQILYRDQDIQIGVRHNIKDEISFIIQIVITNITNTHQMQSSLNKLVLEIVTKNAQSQIIIKEKSIIDSRYKNKNKNEKLNNIIEREGIQQITANKQSLAINTQWRIQMVVVVNDINFRQPVLMTLKYKKQYQNKQRNRQSKMRSIGLILPISKFKLLNLLPYNKSIQVNKISIKNKRNLENESNKITKLFELNPKVVTSLNKLISYFGQEYTQVIKRSNTKKQKDNDRNIIQQQIEQVVVNFEYLTRKIAVGFKPVKENKNKLTYQTYSIDNGNIQSNQIKQQKKYNNKNIIKRQQYSLIIITVSSIDQSNQLILQSIADQFLFVLSRN